MSANVHFKLLKDLRSSEAADEKKAAYKRASKYKWRVVNKVFGSLSAGLRDAGEDLKEVSKAFEKVYKDYCKEFTLQTEGSTDPYFEALNIVGGTILEMGRIRGMMADIYGKERGRLVDAKEKGESATSKIAFTYDNDMDGQIKELKDREDMLTQPYDPYSKKEKEKAA